jgi:long-chain acyl-CoA synthetase
VRLDQLLEASAAAFPDKVALVDGSQRMTYRCLHDRVERLSAVLFAHGVARHDRVVVVLDNSISAVVALFAINRIGACFTLLHPSTKKNAFQDVASRLRAAAVISDARFINVVSSSGSPAICVLMDACGRAVENSLQRTQVTPSGIDQDLAYITFTSGSTGKSKGVMMTHQSSVFAATSISQYLGNHCGDVVLCALPLSFSYGLYQVLVATMVGATVVLENSFAYPVKVLQRMAEERVTGLPLVPTMIAMLVQLAGKAECRVPTLRYITNAAAPLPSVYVERLQSMFPDAELFSMYGQTECVRGTYLPPRELSRRAGSAGKAIPNTEAFIVNSDGEPVAVGEVGELVFRGGHLMQGYWEDPEATNCSLRPWKFSWERVLFTGDLFRQDEEGFLYFVARRDDIIKSGGEKVSPREVEEVLCLLSDVREAAVVGVPDPFLGESVKAFVVLQEGSALSARDIIRHCAAHLEDRKLPRVVEFCDSLPRSNNGKVLHRELRAKISNSSAGTNDTSKV